MNYPPFDSLGGESRSAAVGQTPEAILKRMSERMIDFQKDFVKEMNEIAKAAEELKRI